ncbi:membrane protein involved in aromatic hydrocarbon degradation [Ahrensia sp. R2A130]|uniref:membrane protein involved in aromatic hydrocarbon degradation n=1 Tax=Ahrensia sp. R2A130 TaxID=744979 RepID=UPI0001E093FA|nr:membrane protein involved in aromatic hydrocarbon degradation [Ahrensia sp. R2A130]EFL89977.1 membrane protein involved in aromatic hydrocarbon degradation [Ahrensia sp. R2A130]
MSLKRAILAGVSAALVSTTAMAGGFDRGGVQIDQLFDAGTTMGARAAWVMPQRELKNYQRAGNSAVDNRAALIGGGVQQQVAAFTLGNGGTPPNAAQLAGIQALVTAGVDAALAPLTPASASSVDVEGDYSNFSLGFKVNVSEGVDCLGHYSQPYGADADYGTGNAQSLSAVSFKISTNDYGLTCSYQFSAGETAVGKAFGRIIVGGSYQEIEGFQSRQSFGDFIPLGGFGGVADATGLGLFNVTDEAFGFRVGASYEIPTIALRATVLYSSKYDYDLTGTQNNTGFNPNLALTPVGVVPITASTEIPQALDIRLQSGIREGTLAFLNMRWQDWSQLQSIRINGGLNPADPTGNTGSNLAFEPFYQDGYTISAGVGQVITTELSGLAAIGWDRGTSTTSGTQTDTWTLSGGFQYKPFENMEFNFGGLIGVLTSGTSGPNPAQVDQSNNVTYSFDNDMVYALSGSFKAKF